MTEKKRRRRRTEQKKNRASNKKKAQTISNKKKRKLHNCVCMLVPFVSVLRRFLVVGYYVVLQFWMSYRERKLRERECFVAL
jgi:hypothetical protein